MNFQDNRLSAVEALWVGDIECDFRLANIGSTESGNTSAEVLPCGPLNSWNNSGWSPKTTPVTEATPIADTNHASLLGSQEDIPSFSSLGNFDIYFADYSWGDLMSAWLHSEGANQGHALTTMAGASLPGLYTESYWTSHMSPAPSELRDLTLRSVTSSADWTTRRAGGELLPPPEPTALLCTDAVPSIDPLMVVGEVILCYAIILWLNRQPKLLDPRVGWTMFHVVCAREGISPYEMWGMIGSAILLVIYDLCAVTQDDDLPCLVVMLILALAAASSLGLLLSEGILLLTSLSIVSGAEPSLRLYAYDAANVISCFARVIACATRYVIYDLQVELVDLNLHYTEPTGSADQTASWWVALLTFVFNLTADSVTWLLQVCVVLFKLGIAAGLLWMVVDLFILRTAARSQSNWLRILRQG